MIVPNVDFQIQIERIAIEARFPNGKDLLFSSDVVFFRGRNKNAGSGDIKRWERVFFVESAGYALLYGIDEQEGIPQGFNPELSLQQQLFVKEVRRMTQLSILSGELSDSVSDGRFCWAEGCVTAAFSVARGSGMDIMVGYRHPAKHDYVMEALDKDRYGFIKRALGAHYQLI